MLGSKHPWLATLAPLSSHWKTPWAGKSKEVISRLLFFPPSPSGNNECDRGGFWASLWLCTFSRAVHCPPFLPFFQKMRQLFPGRINWKYCVCFIMLQNAWLGSAPSTVSFDFIRNGKWISNMKWDPNGTQAILSPPELAANSRLRTHGPAHR